MKKFNLALIFAAVAMSACAGDSFQFQFSPANKTLRVRQATENTDSSVMAKYVVTDKKDGKKITEFEIPAVKWSSKTVDVGELDGEYRITMTTGDTKVEKDFERKHFPWEGNTLGKSRTVYPPFTPIVVKEGESPTLSTVLRTHTLGQTGLPAQIEATGKKLLAAPIGFTVNEKPVIGSELKFVEKSDDRVVTESKLTGDGGFEATARGIWEEDGCLRYELTILKGDINHMTLVMPMTSEAATMIHAIGSMRNTTSARLSKKEGSLWIAKNVHNAIKNFAPYVFLGDPHRGLAWWCEGPQGWNWANEYSNCAVIRRDGNVVLEAYLFGKQMNVTEPRKIVMGFQAAPVKPRPKDWLTRWVKSDWQLVATDICWFSESNCGGVQPVGGHTELWDWMADCYLPGRKPDLTKIEEIMQPIDEYVKVYGEKDAKMLSSEFRRMMKQHEEWGRYKNFVPMFYFNRSVWNNLPEWKTFNGDWMLQYFNFEFPQKASRNEIYIDPGVESYLDYACWWWKKSFETGNRGVYCDNYFNMVTWNPVTGNGFNRNVIWSLRTQAKRVRQMMCELGMEPFFWPHMTSQMVLPWMGYAEGQLDWEWNFGKAPLQRRFSKAYLELVSYGELGGIIPQILWDRDGGLHGNALNTFSAGMNALGITSQSNFDGAKFDHVVRENYVQADSFKFVNSIAEGPKPVELDDPSALWGLYYIPGKRAMFVALSWNKEKHNARVKFDYKALGLPEPRTAGVGRRKTAKEVTMQADEINSLDDVGMVKEEIELELDTLECSDRIEDAPLKLGKEGFDIDFGSYGVFAAEIKLPGLEDAGRRRKK